MRIGCCRDRRLLFPLGSLTTFRICFAPIFSEQLVYAMNATKCWWNKKATCRDVIRSSGSDSHVHALAGIPARNTVYRVEIFFHKRKKMLWRVKKKKLKCKYFIKRPFKNWQCVVVHYGSLLDRVLCGWVTNLSGVYLKCGWRPTADLCTAGCGPPSSIAVCVMPATRAMTQETLVFSLLNPPPCLGPTTWPVTLLWLLS